MMELGAFPDKLRKQAIGIGQVLKNGDVSGGQG